MSASSERATAWIYRGLWSVLVEWFRVPDQPPDLPVRSGQFIDRFRPAEGYLRYLQFWFWIVALLIDAGLFIGYVVVSVALAREGLGWVAVLLAPPVLVIMIVPDIIAYIAIHLRYDTTWYVITDRSLRLRRGIWTIHEMTLTFDNVQNVKVRQGPVQRAFGIASLMVETAGAGGGSGHNTQAVANRGIIEGIADPQRLRDLILARLRRARGSGLGDPDEAIAGRAWTAAHVQALREIRDALVAGHA